LAFKSRAGEIMNKLKEIYAYRQMIISLVHRDLRGRYKGSVLGFLWTFINPLLQLMVYTLVFSVILRAGIEKYYLFLFVALIPWIFFSSSVAAGSSCILHQSDLVKKIYFPREVLPIAHVTTCFVNMLLSFVVIFLVIIISGIGISLNAILCLPIIMIVEYILALGMAMIFSALTVFLRDLEYILGIIIMAWQFMTPIMYSIDIVPESIIPVFMANPMTPIIIAYRDILYYKQIPELGTLLHALILGLAVLFIGSIVFNKLQKRFAEEL
jgi:lipopolysaccharide transport system permease protein